MAIFNPDVPNTRDPSYLGYSHPIPQPESNKSATFAGQAQEYLGEKDKYAGVSKGYDYQSEAASVSGAATMWKDAGEIFGNTVKAADTYTKSVIENQVYDKASALRDYYTAQLAQLPQGQTNPVTAGTQSPVPILKPSTTGMVGAEGAGAENQPLNLLPVGGQVPQAVSTAIDNADWITQARQNGKLSETDYIGRMNTISKGIRDQYPTYKEYIDAQFEKVTGMNPANALVKSYVADINAGLAGAKSTRDHILNELSSPAFVGYPGASGIWQGIASGNLPMEAGVKWMNAVKADQTRWQYISDQNANYKGTIDNMKLQAQSTFNASVPTVVNQMFMGLTANSKHPALGAANDITTFAQSVASGETPITALEAKQVGEALTGMRSQAFAHLYQQATKAGYVEAMGAGEVTKMINESLVLYDNTASLISQNKWDLASSVANYNKAVAEDTANMFLKDKKVGPFMKAFAGARQLVGDQYVGELTRQLLTQTNMDSQTKAWAKDDFLKILGQEPADPRKPKLNPATPRAETPEQTIDGVVKRAKEAGIQDPNYFSWINSVPKEIANKNLPDTGKMNLLRATFDPSMQDYLGKVAKTGWDSKGRKVSGQDELFADWTNPDITKEVLRLDKAHPGNNFWNNYKTWAETTFSTTLASQHINDLGNIQNFQAIKLAYSNVDGIPQFTVLPSNAVEGKMAKQMAGGNPGGYVQAQRTVGLLNQGLRNIATISKTEGKDPDAYVAQLLIGMGWDPQSGKSPATVPDWLGNALINSRPAPKGQKSSYNEESAPNSGSVGQRGSLESFMHNPAGVVAGTSQIAPAVNSVRPRGNLSDSQVLGMQTTDVRPEEDLNAVLGRK